MSNDEAIGSGITFIIRNCMSDIRFSFRNHGALIILELPAAEELAKHKPKFVVRKQRNRLLFPARGAHSESLASIFRRSAAGRESYAELAACGCEFATRK
jgi:hypothetical protein